VLAVLGFLWPAYCPIGQSVSKLGAVDAPQAILMEILGFQLLGIFMAGGYFVTVSEQPILEGGGMHRYCY